MLYQWAKYNCSDVIVTLESVSLVFTYPYGNDLRPSALPFFPSAFASLCLIFANLASSAASLSSLLTCSRASRTAFFALKSAASASLSAASACRRDCVAAWIDGSPEPRCRTEEWRLVDDVLVWCEDVDARWMSELEERRREKKPVLRSGDTGAGGGEGSRRPKRGIAISSWY